MLTLYPDCFANDSEQNKIMNSDNPETLKQGLRFLFKRYLENQCEAIALKIVNQLEKILLHSDCIGFPHDRCHYYRLLNNWRAQCFIHHSSKE